jgi:hypothetical protein
MIRDVDDKAHYVMIDLHIGWGISRGTGGYKRRPEEIE